MSDERDGFHDRQTGVFVHAEWHRDVHDRRADADHGRDPDDPAMREHGPSVAQPPEPQRRRLRLQEEAAHDHGRAARNVDIDQRIERAAAGCVVFGEHGHQRARDDHEYHQRQHLEERVQCAAGQALQQRPVMRGVTLAAHSVLLGAGRRDIRGCLFLDFGRFARACGAAFRRGFTRPAQQAAREPFGRERRQQCTEQRPYDAAQPRVFLRIRERIAPPRAHGRHVEQRFHRMAQRGAAVREPVRALARELRSEAVLLKRGGHAARRIAGRGGRRSARRRGHRRGGERAGCGHCTQRVLDLRAAFRVVQHVERLTGLIGRQPHRRTGDRSACSRLDGRLRGGSGR